MENINKKEFLENKIKRINNLIETFKDKGSIPMIEGDIPIHTIKWVSIDKVRDYIKELEEELKRL